MRASVTVEEFNDLLFTDDNGKADGSGSLVRDENGDFTLTLVLTRDAAAEASGEEELTAEDLALMQEMGDQMPMHYSFVFPETIGRASGALNCLSLSGNKVLIDLLDAMVQLENSGEESLTFVFSTKDPSFSDTPLTAWYTAAVEAMAGGGLVEGGGDGRFYPDKTLTVSEFAQILAKATGMPVGAGDGGYWAELALEGCRDAGYITDRGDATRANYEVPIERQEAVAAMQRAGKRTPTGSFTAADIPDFASIDPALRADILAAYNSGVTKGTDDLRTFVPAGLLSRGQVCQLFSNLQWTAPLG
ncbi:MAG: S-layer homology domain-containing protein, partial [Oscillospiraceae bacterium]|nr:S-layer homology domain-containing protein [Oscillospiraceae bacterium]